MSSKKILILGASYGSLFATKLLMAGHQVTLVCTRPTADLINREGTLVRFPVKGRTQPVSLDSRELPGQLVAATPEEIDPSSFDLAVLGMQEAQYGEDGVRQLMTRLAQGRVPCLAIMNMPPLPYLRRIPKLRVESLEGSYTDPSVWRAFDPALVTLASPDPQAFRPADEPKNVLQVGLPTNFKAARFGGEGPTALPVKLKVHESLFVPLAKWPMLLTGNYRCIREDGMVPIQEAVHGNLALSRDIYEWVSDLCCRLGADRDDLVPFDKYAAAAASLKKPSSAARALFGGARNIERVDSLVRRIAAQLGLSNEHLQETVALIDARLELNRAPRELLAA
ncbi:MAG: hypothetical protein EOO24_48380 [Comamonadaceae bacterium]|nr:MAG: hypothetical protein EOO24_48380 [Comamonadaceae bacterium]